MAYSQEGSRKITVQVKALSKKNPVPLGGKLDHLFADYIVVCRNALSEKPECFLFMPDQIKDVIHRVEKDGKPSYWLEPRDYATDSFRENWQLIGTGQFL